MKINQGGDPAKTSPPNMLGRRVFSPNKEGFSTRGRQPTNFLVLLKKEKLSRGRKRGCNSKHRRRPFLQGEEL